MSGFINTSNVRFLVLGGASRPVLSLDTRNRGWRSGKVGISRGWRDFQGSVGSGENLPLVFAGFHNSAFSTALGGFCFPSSAVAVEASHHMRAITNRDTTIQMFMNGDRAAGQRMPESGLVYLPGPGANSDRVVFRHHALGLNREHPIQIRPAATAEGRSLFLCRYLELGIELRDVTIRQKTVRLLYRLNLGQPEFLRHASLPGTETSFRASPRLWRVRRDHLHSQLFHRPAHLCQTLFIYGLAGLRRHEKMAATIAVQSAKQPLFLGHLAQRRHHRARGFLVH